MKGALVSLAAYFLSALVKNAEEIRTRQRWILGVTLSKNCVYGDGKKMELRGFSQDMIEEYLREQIRGSENMWGKHILSFNLILSGAPRAQS
ncbi:hypothetical protein SAMN02745702_01431 [Desulfobaculum bizertense DSM 18034]|uniref:Uncharacterized protein n=1 Tax=Desulfobaculum bizertense DSM 18034 TaxID=1121442 RepID=A0A1T4W1R4_9BACT|nr:hypothetical protein SAMN02745702_01431 [Desulfobaculum bizertense DSM 18034]